MRQETLFETPKKTKVPKFIAERNMKDISFTSNYSLKMLEQVDNCFFQPRQIISFDVALYVLQFRRI